MTSRKQLFAERTAVKRWGQVADMVGPALLLSSDAGAFITRHRHPGRRRHALPHF